MKKFSSEEKLAEMDGRHKNRAGWSFSPTLSIQWTSKGLLPQSLAYFMRAPNRIGDPFQT
jgi:hypothetical protein